MRVLQQLVKKLQDKEKEVDDLLIQIQTEKVCMYILPVWGGVYREGISRAKEALGAYATEWAIADFFTRALCSTFHSLPCLGSSQDSRRTLKVNGSREGSLASTTAE